MKDPLDRFLEKVQVGPLPVEWTGKPEGRTECLLWTAAKNSWGYAYFGVNKKIVRAHKWIYEQCITFVPKKLQLDHLCRVRHCVNPLHLEPVTKSQNMSRSPIHKEKTKKIGLKNRKYNLPKGVSFSKNKNKFVARKQINGQTIYLGTFKTPEKALKAYQNFI